MMTSIPVISHLLYVYFIPSLRHAFGDTANPLYQSAVLIEEIVHRQISNLVTFLCKIFLFVVKSARRLKKVILLYLQSHSWNSSSYVHYSITLILNFHCITSILSYSGRICTSSLHLVVSTTYKLSNLCNPIWVPNTCSQGLLTWWSEDKTSACYIQYM